MTARVLRIYWVPGSVTSRGCKVEGKVTGWSSGEGQQRIWRDSIVLNLAFLKASSNFSNLSSCDFFRCL
jgi:hypothetical protein